MAKTFDPLRFDPVQCRREVEELRQFLADHPSLGEKALYDFFVQRRQLTVFLASSNPDIVRYDLLAYQYDIFGDFTCDIAVGDSVTRSYSFIEFEDATEDSLFVKVPNKATREWSRRFDHGYSQLIDWFYKLNDRRNSDENEARFGQRSIHWTGMLVVGRNHFLDAGERLRLQWRREHVIVHSKQIQCLTFDELCENLLARLILLPSADRTERPEESGQVPDRAADKPSSAGAG